MGRYLMGYDVGSSSIKATLMETETGQAVASAAAIAREFIRDGNKVWVMEPKGQLAIRPVEIAFWGSERLLVTGGIQAGERLVVTDLAAPVAGMALRTADDSVEQAATRQPATREGQS